MQDLAVKAGSATLGSKAVQGMRKLGANLPNLSQEILEHRSYRWILKAMANATEVLESVYNDLLKAHCEPKTTAEWWAYEAAGKWKEQVTCFFTNLASWRALEQYGFSNKKTAEIFDAGVDTDPAYRELRDRSQFIFSMHVELAAEHAWHTVRREYCMPERQAIFNHPDAM
eukprot:7428871-Karenia_brevis.AAC.1